MIIVKEISKQISFFNSCLLRIEPMSTTLHHNIRPKRPHSGGTVAWGLVERFQPFLKAFVLRLKKSMCKFHQVMSKKNFDVRGLSLAFSCNDLSWGRTREQHNLFLRVAGCGQVSWLRLLQHPRGGCGLNRVGRLCRLKDYYNEKFIMLLPIQ
ncbi:hypothetical protein FF38_06296 [Lucilia cuprina]|uniref:Uncharacterized protein n=1 Tax=Lucilia cuprina TaxID=7375 RepID=A0A0L0C7V3_LUCCU|nr:hypothetical protein FF38_06296 [Lucilia cuprina]